MKDYLDDYFDDVLNSTMMKKFLEILPKLQQGIQEMENAKAVQKVLEHLPTQSVGDDNAPVFELSAVKDVYIDTPKNNQNVWNKLMNKGKEIYSKYEGLDPGVAFQKVLSKANIPTTEREYYGLSSHLSDGEGPTQKDLEQNSFYTVGSIKNPELQQFYAKKSAEMHGLDINNPAHREQIMNTKVVIPKVDSNLYNHLKNSQTTKDYVANNYEKYQNGTIQPRDKHITYPLDITDAEKRALFATVHNADMSPSKINKDGSFTAFPTDSYNYEKWPYKNLLKSKNPHDFWSGLKHNAFTYINNNAQKQQQAGQLENYIITAPVTYTKNEVEGLRRKKQNNTNKLKGW